MDFHGFSTMFMDFHRFSWILWIFIDFHRFPVYFMRFHDFRRQELGGLWQRCGGIILAPKEEVSKLGGSNIRVLETRGLAGLAGLAGRRMEQRSLARSMLWRDRRIILES